MFKPVFPKQFRQFHLFLKILGYLYEAFEISEIGTSAKKVTLRDAKEDVDKICIEVQKTSDKWGWKPTCVSHFNIKHLYCFELRFESEFLTVYVCGKRKREVGLVWPRCYRARTGPQKVAEVLSTSRIPRVLLAFFTLNLRNKMQCVHPCQSRKKLTTSYTCNWTFFL